jgi:hypothetical protein
MKKFNRIAGNFLVKEFNEDTDEYPLVILLRVSIWIFLVAGYIVFKYLFSETDSSGESFLTFYLWFIIVYTIASPFIFSVSDGLKSSAQAERHFSEGFKLFNEKVEQEKVKTYDVALLSLKHVEEYYRINKSQTRRIFSVSVLAITVGFLTILTGIYLLYTSTEPNVTVTIITGASGIILQFIGGAYFLMYKRSLEQVEFFFNQLMRVQDVMLAISLVEKVNNKEKEENAVEKIITSLLEKSLK